MFKFLLDVLFPPRCLICDKHSRILLCPECEPKLKIADTLFCGSCGARLPRGRRECHPKFPCLMGAATIYEAESKELIWGLKFRYLKSAAEPLARLLGTYFSKLNLPAATWTIVPVPLSKERERERGFNQAELIANRFAGFTGLPLNLNVLKRTKHTAPQSELKGHELRFKNVQGCFEAAVNPAPKAVILIDDVITSGATLSEAAKALKAAGARKIIALAVAKA